LDFYFALPNLLNYLIFKEFGIKDLSVNLEICKDQLENQPKNQLSVEGPFRHQCSSSPPKPPFSSDGSRMVHV